MLRQHIRFVYCCCRIFICLCFLFVFVCICICVKVWQPFWLESEKQSYMLRRDIRFVLQDKSIPYVSVANLGKKRGIAARYLLFKSRTEKVKLLCQVFRAHGDFLKLLIDIAGKRLNPRILEATLVLLKNSNQTWTTGQYHELVHREVKPFVSQILWLFCFNAVIKFDDKQCHLLTLCPIRSWTALCK